MSSRPFQWALAASLCWPAMAGAQTPESAPAGSPRVAPQYGSGPYYPAAPAPPPPQKPDAGFELPTLSVRVDPVDWLIYGRLGIELEAELLRFLSVELVPAFVVDSRPPILDWSYDTEAISQHSNGLGALAGTSLGVGFWLDGKPLRGTVLRAIFTNYAFTYRASDEAGVFDEVSHTERHFYGFLGSNRTWGAFTFAGGFGLGVELNKQRRCFQGGRLAAPTSDCPRDELHIALTRSATNPVVGDLNSPFHPVEIFGRLSLGVTF